MSIPKLLLLHGALGASPQFDSLKRALQDDFEIFTMNFPGHGGREIPKEDFSFTLFVKDILSFLDDHSINRINIFGYSMGGYAALWMAKNHPERVQKIFTLATKMDWNEATAAREASMLTPEKMEEKIPAFAELLKQRHAPKDWKQIIRKTADMMIGLGKNYLPENDFRSIKHSITISVGDKDSMVSMDESRRVAEFLPNGTLTILPETYHPLEKVEMDKLVTEMRLFFKNNLPKV